LRLIPLAGQFRMAEEAADRGKQAFQSKDFAAAVAAYTEAIEKDGADFKHFSNRSACYAELGKFDEALSDAEKCISLNKDWVRGYTRKGLALHRQYKMTEAEEAYKEALQRDPTSEIAKRGLDDIKKLRDDTEKFMKFPKMPMRKPPTFKEALVKSMKDSKWTFLLYAAVMGGFVIYTQFFVTPKVKDYFHVQPIGVARGMVRTPDGEHVYFVTSKLENTTNASAPILCLHQAGWSSAECDGVLTAAANEGRMAFAVDLPGHGSTDASSTGNYTSALQVAVAHLNVPKFAVLASGVEAARASFALAKEMPEAVVALAVVGWEPHGHKQGVDSLPATLEAAKASGLTEGDKALKALLAESVRGSMHEVPEGTAEDLTAKIVVLAPDTVDLDELKLSSADRRPISGGRFAVAANSGPVVTSMLEFLQHNEL